MNDQDYIKAGVEQADGWKWNDPIGYVTSPFGLSYIVDELPQWFLDALAAQLTEQVDAVGGADKEFIVALLLNVFRDATSIDDCRTMPPGRFEIEGDNRAMNTIKVVVDSKVLA